MLTERQQQARADFRRTRGWADYPCLRTLYAEMRDAWAAFHEGADWMKSRQLDLAFVGSTADRRSER